MKSEPALERQEFNTKSPYNLMNNNIRNGFHILVLLVMVILIDNIIGMSMRVIFSKQESGALSRTLYAMDSTTAEILIFGASRANHHYNTSIFRKKLPEYTNYNCGNDGSSIFYHYSILRTILNRYTPETIILDIGPGAFSKNQGSYDKLSYLLPFIHNHPDIREVVHLKSSHERIKLLSKVYPYNSLLLSIVGGILNIHSNDNISDDGFVALSGEWSGELAIDSSRALYPIDNNKVKYFETFIEICHNAGVNVIVTCSPRYLNKLYTDSSLKLVQEITNRKKVIFYNYSSDTSYLNDRSLFRDIAHLNAKGAAKYTEEIIKRIFEDDSLQMELFIIEDDFVKSIIEK
jgi:hypothetical protein